MKPSKTNLGCWLFGLLCACIIVCPTAGIFWAWNRVTQTPDLTQQHSQEFSPPIADFVAKEQSLDVKLQPERILEVATENYLNMHKDYLTLCSKCERFWTSLSATTSGVCVLEYTPTKSVVRATTIELGYTVDAQTYKASQEAVPYKSRATYHLVKENGVWKVDKITDYTLPGQGQADLIKTLQEDLAELGCPKLGR